MPRVAIPASAMSMRSADVAKAMAEKVSSSLSLLTDREIRLAIEGFDEVTAPLAYEPGTRVGFEFRVNGAATGRLLVVVSLADAATLCGLLCMMSAGQIAERRKSPALGPEDADSLHEIGNLLRGAIEEGCRVQSPVQLHLAAAGTQEAAALLAESGESWPKSLAARGRFAVEGMEPAPAEILLELPIAKALDPKLDLDAALGRTAAAQPAEATGVTARGPLQTVFLVEPDPFYAKLLASALAPTAHVVAAPSVKKLRALLRASPKAAVVIDVADDDVEVVREIAALRSAPDAPQVLATVSSPTRSLVVRLAQAGVTRILPKPYSRGAVAKHLADLLSPGE